MGASLVQAGNRALSTVTERDLSGRKSSLHGNVNPNLSNKAEK